MMCFRISYNIIRCDVNTVWTDMYTVLIQFCSDTCTYITSTLQSILIENKCFPYNNPYKLPYKFSSRSIMCFSISYNFIRGNNKLWAKSVIQMPQWISMWRTLYVLYTCTGTVLYEYILHSFCSDTVQRKAFELKTNVFPLFLLCSSKVYCTRG